MSFVDDHRAMGRVSGMIGEFLGLRLRDGETAAEYCERVERKMLRAIQDGRLIYKDRED